jgi:prophage tail gpP-like protein
VPDDVALYVNGQVFSGWEKAGVKRSLETVSGAFELEVSDERSGATSWPVRPGSACRLQVDDDVVIDGFVDGARVQLGPETHTLAVEGRDRTGDLVDCSAMNAPGEWWGLTALEIAAELAAPFGIQVAAELGDLGALFNPFALQPGESAWEALERACRARGILATGDGAGGVLLTQPGSGGLAQVALVEGDNIRASSLEINAAGRYRDYIVRGQQGASVDVPAEECAAVEGRATDAGARAGRTLLILAEGAVDLDVAQRRASWEAAVRYARASRLTVRLSGWREVPGGALWRPNRLVNVSAPTLGVVGRMLVVTVGLRLTGGEGGGTDTELELAWPESYLPEVELKPAEDPADAFGADLEEVA